MDMKLAMVLVVTLGLVAQSTQEVISIYKEINRVDDIGDIDVGGDCVNMQPYQDKKVKSVDAHSNCFLLYAGKDCAGRSQKVGVKDADSCPNDLDLSSCTFTDLTSSIKKCDTPSGGH